MITVPPIAPEGYFSVQLIDLYTHNFDYIGSRTTGNGGGLTLLIQHESPGKDNEANWLPAPEGPFSMMMRLYWPQAAALDGSWQAPPLQPVS